ncbi:hypothetical protein BS78_08G074900 [Paspalum vaginatum]|nr:hypothetical protein BS78_08G074900 [Paspalum vaginatum]
MMQGNSSSGGCGYGPIGLPLISCPKCGSQVVECKSWKNGGKPFFKCVRNEEFVPGRYNFYKWIEHYEKMINGKVEVEKSGSSSGAIGFIDEPYEMEKLQAKIVDDGKLERAQNDKLIRLVECLVVIGIILVVLVFLGVVGIIVK